MQTISRNRWIFFALLAVTLLFWFSMTQTQLPALSAPRGIGNPA
jgi:hypothetical protein